MQYYMFGGEERNAFEAHKVYIVHVCVKRIDYGWWPHVSGAGRRRSGDL